jgi:hypothetical protein
MAGPELFVITKFDYIVKLGFKDQGYAKFTFIMNKILLYFWSLIKHYSLNFHVITNHGHNEHISVCFT